ncbi:polymorphic toxin type 23 domain-containing protein [Saprospiraceae bacterium]|nr:polymorphic toxin type 23 domain-containing protein [Saprospiraceae bacterium]
MGEKQSKFNKKRSTQSTAFAESLATNTGASLNPPSYGGQNTMPPMNMGSGRPGSGFSAGVGLSFKFGGRKDSGFKIKVFAQHNQDIGAGFSGAAGIGASYHSNFYGTGKSGVELRGSAGLNYEKDDFSASLGTNKFKGFGGLEEFDQRTGYLSAKYKDFGLAYENDGTPFGKMGLGDGNDQFRTAAASIQIGEFNLDMNLFTGGRDQDSFDQEEKLPGGSQGLSEGEGQFGENYANGFVVEKGPKYRMGNLTLNHGGTALGVDSEWVRHTFQNIIAHDLISPQRQFPMLTGDWTPVYEKYMTPRSQFSLWDR